MAEGGENPVAVPGTSAENFIGRKEEHGTLNVQNIDVKGPTNCTIENCNVIGFVNGNVGVRNEQQRRILDFTRDNIRRWTSGMINVSIADVLIGRLNKGHKLVTIVGNAGDGKTTLAYLVLKEFVDKMNVYVIETPEEYGHISKIKENRIIMLNDIFGAFTCDLSTLNSWTNVVKSILDSHKSSTDLYTRLLIVSRTNVIQEAKDHLEHYGEMLLDGRWCVDLSQIIQEKERLQILEYHLIRNKVTIPERDREMIASTTNSHGFPHCSEMYAKLKSEGHDIDIFDFFESPLKFIDKTTRVLFRSGCEDLFINLVKNDGTFNINRVQDDKERRDLRDAACKQVGSYLHKNKSGIWSFTHPSIYESVLSILAERDPLLLARFSSLSVLLQKVRIKTSSDVPNTCYILLDPEPDVLDALVKRFIQEILNGVFDIIKHRLCHNQDLCQRLVKACVQNPHHQDIINRTGWDHSTMLHCAVGSSNHTAVRCLLEQDADITTMDIWNRTALSIMCSMPQIDASLLQVLARKSHNCINRCSRLEGTPLHRLCESKGVCIQTLQILVGAGSQVNKTDQKGRTSLHHLCENRHAKVDAVSFLISQGADVNLKDISGQTALHYLCMSEKVCKEMLHILVDARSQINESDSCGQTPLHLLCANAGARADTVSCLISQGADVSLKDRSGQTALHYLCLHRTDDTDECSAEIIELLVRCGININQPDERGRTALHYICIINKETLKKFTIAKDLRCDKYGISRIVSSIYNCGPNILIMHLLIDKKADVNHSDIDMTTLHSICFQETDNSAVQVLIKSGSVVNACDEDGSTPLHYLCQQSLVWLYQNKATLKLLLDSGADVNKTDNDGLTPLEYLDPKGRQLVHKLKEDAIKK